MTKIPAVRPEEACSLRRLEGVNAAEILIIF
jgi:hypothetical protein